nr:immunoglobulin light chain junction region [Macaca mulatta]
CMQYRHISPTF